MYPHTVTSIFCRGPTLRVKRFTGMGLQPLMAYFAHRRAVLFRSTAFPNITGLPSAIRGQMKAPLLGLVVRAESTSFYTRSTAELPQALPGCWIRTNDLGLSRTCKLFSKPECCTLGVDELV